MTGDANSDREHWTKAADKWVAWARQPGHDAFWAYRDHLANYIGEGSGQALEVGCGEGRVSRLLKSCGYRVSASDPVGRLVNAAREADSAHEYVMCAAGDLPFAAHSFDLVVAYNVLMDIENIPAALAEMRRVMRPTGLLMVSIVHPFADIGRVVNDTPDAPFVITEPYFGRKQFEASETRDGLQMDFSGWSRPLHQYAEAFENTGLAISSLREPVPEIKSDSDHMKKWTRIPLFLWLKAKPLS